jgi:hypothetical protein
MNKNNESLDITDELIMAYVDGELEPEQSDKVAAAIAVDEQLRQQEILFRETASVLDHAFDAPMHEEIPERLQAVLRPPEKTSLQERFMELVAQLGRGIAPLPATAMALVAVLGIAVVLNGTWQDSFSESSITRVLTQDGFTQVLDTAVSGSTDRIRIGRQEAEVVPLLTFQDKNQRFCRYFELIVSDESFVGQGVSCRSAKGVWETVAFAADKAEVEKSQTDTRQGYELASGENRMERIVESMRAGQPLRLTDERRCIDGGWKGCQ